jgi:branched-chain amino acid transport system permease protein
MKKKYILFVIAVIAIYTLLFAGRTFSMINSYVEGVIVSILINVIMAVSLALVTGYLGELVLGHAGFMAVGAYTSAILTLHLDLPKMIEFPIAVIAGGLVSALLGILIGIPALRLKGDYLAIITLGFGEIIRIILNNLKITNGARGLSGIPGYSNFTITFVITVTIIAILYLLIHSRHGRSILAIRENEIAAECIGISSVWYKTFAFAIAAFFAGVGGGLYAHYNQVLNPGSFGFLYSIEFLIIVVLGGMGNLFGTIASAVGLGTINEMLRSFSHYRMLVYSLVLIIIMILKAKGFSLLTLRMEVGKKLKKVGNK